MGVFSVGSMKGCCINKSNTTRLYGIAVILVVNDVHSGFVWASYMFAMANKLPFIVGSKLVLFVLLRERVYPSLRI